MLVKWFSKSDKSRKDKVVDKLFSESETILKSNTILSEKKLV